MEFLGQFIAIVLHLDVQLAQLLQQYGAWVYGILFVIVFCETGLVVTPFLPGDSLLFVAGTLAAAGAGLEIGPLTGVLLAAAVIGDNTNYWIGRWAGARILHWGDGRFINRAAFDRTHAFYERHGGKTLAIARFMPLVRTFAPFVAGIAHMTYPRFFVFDFCGGVAWIFSLCFAGYWFGNLPAVRSNLSFVILGIVAVSLLPVAIGWLRQRHQVGEP
jgi:membrane-associated protein